ncbi:DUF1176 domain-containing protein [uncultured Psychrobacter sp.]|uniref:DUF1176 domain-containing protein n=1 Tax=uncultured Psychrobacter sp. TaxID=259303 RepID=UPI0034589F50
MKDLCYKLEAALKSSCNYRLLSTNRVRSLLITTSTALLSTLGYAGEELVHQDWQVACDNTRTCRLAGYQAENNSDFPVSVMLVRRAGSEAEVAGKVKLGGGKESSSKALLQLGNRHRMSLFIDDKDLGETKPFSTVAGDAELTSAQVNALLEALTKSSKIELVLRNSRWQLSDKGATAVMVKADEVQGRVGTSSALVGIEGATKSNSNVLAPMPAPQLRLVVPDPKMAANTKKFTMKASQLSALVKGTIKDVDTSCPNLSNKTPWRISRLSDSQLLIQHNCWSGAYNVGNGIWVINDTKPYNPVLVTTNATHYDSGKISSIQKGRGIGDCLNKTDWIWTGKRFEKSHQSSTGMCRMIEAGGAWQLPTYVSEVNAPQ